ncbi:MAG TPA: hypothetical protein VKM55_12790 [Candidatus Lokiarchaeia archaeon]|nr:hypothetical protein [Candidatus Lokiarchaeia archaeon]
MSTIAFYENLVMSIYLELEWINYECESMVYCLSQENENPSETKGTLKDAFRIKKERLIWIDQGRGFVMFILVLTELMPGCLKSACYTSNVYVKALAGFFLDHPANSTSAPYMNIYDVGVPAFFFIIGLLMAVSFKKRIETHGRWNAVANSALRWGLLYGLGLAIIFFTYKQGFGDVEQIAPGVYAYVVSWDVIPALGFVGLVSIPFMFLPNKARLIIAYAMMTFYQIMTFIPQMYWREYAAASVHGGIIGGIFVMTGFVLVGSCVGEYFLLNKEASQHKKYMMLALLSVINLAIGLGLWAIPGGFPNKRQSTMGWATISIAIVIAGLFGFIFLNLKKQHKTVILEAYGMNPFLIYALAVVPGAIINALLPDSVTSDFLFQATYWIGAVAGITALAIGLYMVGKAISTTKVIAVLLVILLPVGIIAKLFGVI